MAAEGLLRVPACVYGAGLPRQTRRLRLARDGGKSWRWRGCVPSAQGPYNPVGPIYNRDQPQGAGRCGA